jgi:predicted enzyme related to lactoylglutathione lyase
MSKKYYTCYVCSFGWKVDEDHVPEICPGCGASPDQYLIEPGDGSQPRRMHVDPPQPDPDWDPMDTRYHHPKFFPARTRHGRIRRFVLPYDDAQVTRDFYADVFGWDILDVEGAGTAEPLLFAATGPGNANWEPRVPSFGYGYLEPRAAEGAVPTPRYVIEVDDLDATVAQVVEYGGRLLEGRHTRDGQQVAVIEDSEGTPLYLWETPATVTWDEPESQTMTSVRRFRQPVKADELR